MGKEKSNCCNADAKVDSADEGTSCYICEKCGKPCDLKSWEDVATGLNDEYGFLQYQKNWLREQIKSCDKRQDEIKKLLENL